MTAAADRLDRLSPKQRAVLEQRLRERQAGHPGDRILPRPASVIEVPLSFAQQRLWFLDQLTPGSTAYNMSHAVRIEGELDPRKLELALAQVVRRHESLRTVFRRVESDGVETPAQLVVPRGRISLPWVDLSGLGPAAGAEALRRAAGFEGLPFDLARGPLLRLLLLRLAPADHVVQVVMHHIVSDLVSLELLVRELVAHYEALRHGRPASLPALPVQYPDYTLWQRQRLSGHLLEAELAHWRERLRDLPPHLELPTDRPHGTALRARGARHTSPPGREILEAVRQVALDRSATPFMVFLAAFQALLGRLSGQDDFGIGTPVAGRNRPETENLIGLFINTLVLRAALRRNPPFLELLERVRHDALEAFAHQDLPFEKLVEEVAPERNLARSPLFQVVFALQNVPPASLRLPGFSVTGFPLPRAEAKFDLTALLRETSEGLWVTWEYRTDLFDAPTVARLGVHFEVLLAEALARPEARISDLPLLSEPERHQLLADWNDTRYEASGAPCLHERFAAQARRTPDAVAVTASGEALTYGELARRARRLARRLRRRGVGPDRRVGLFVDRSPEMIVGLLGILEAGGAYVPLDPESPPERLAFLAADAGLPWLVTRQSLRSRLPEFVAEILLLDDPEEAGDEEEPGAAGRALPESLMYVIYTSGSTGRPKGVMVTHGNAVHLFEAARRRFDFDRGDVWTLFHSFAFDFSVWEIWGALLYGGRLVLVPWEAGRSPEVFRDLLVREGVTVLNQTPSSFLQLLPHLEAEEGLALRYLIFGGEALEPRALGSWPERPAGPLSVNMYGITETTVHVTFRALGPADRGRGAAGSPIGRPLPGLRALLLDRWSNPVPVGVPGEIHVAGLGVMRGYLGRPELTAERIVPDPFGEPGGRLYRSGDLARQCPDGELEYLGRIDHQVKIRGFRIELGEVEAALVTLAGVREAVVVPREDRPGDRRLVAYVAGDVTADALRQALRERLPDYMVPAAFMILEALPLTSNGKVDRKALPAPQWQRERGYVAPRTLTEEVLAGIWAELLGLERVGADDHFFDLGGHSLLATRVMSRLRSAFGVEMPLRDLFEAPTPADLAVRVEAARRTGTGRLAPPLVPVPRQGLLPLSFAQQRLWFIDQLEPGNPLYNIAVALRVEGPLRSEVLARSLAEIVRRHEALRTAFEKVDGAPVQVIRPAPLLGLPVVDLSGLPESVREAAVLPLAGEEAARPFDLARGPLLRAVLLRRAEGDHVATLTLHHIVSDGWSMGILVREVTALYAAFAEGRPSPLPELPVQYVDFAAWQRSWLQGEALESEISFWRQQLAGLPPRLELPTDRPRPAVQSFRGATRPVRLPAELVRPLQALSRREGATLFMVLLAGFQVLLARYSGQKDLAVGMPVAGRNRVEIEDLIGFFVNTLVLRGDLAGEPSFQELLGRVRETVLAAHTHQDVPFERLVQELSPERSLGQTPLFQVMLVLQNAPVEGLEIQDLRLHPVSGTGTTAKFDLTLSLREHDGGLLGSIELATDLFDLTTIDRLMGHFERLLASAVATPDRSISALPLSSPAERWQILGEWNDTRASGLAEGCLHEAVSAQAVRTPSAVAVELGAERWTYRRLVGSARHLARHLRELGVGPDVIVGLCAERSPAMVVGMLAVLEAGGSYLPLEPGNPVERTTWMLDDSGARVVLIQEPLLERVPVGDRRVVLLDERWDSEEMGEALQTGVTPDHLAYVIYTSGSTGRPKGVMVPHRGVCNRLRWAQEVYRLDSRDAVLQKASFGFDISVWECFAPLSAGARLVLAEPGRQSEGSYLVRVLREHRVTLVDFGPSLLAVFLEEEDVETCTSLRQIFVGGEALTPELRDRALARLSVPLDNQYGPTEISIDTARWACAPGQDPHRVPIGRPIANSRLYVVGPELLPAPVGVAGELWVGGAGLTRGYLRRPDLTAERFVPDPWSGDSGGRLYRTGDLARWLPDGSLDFLGRVDRQVKIRGFRIELGEIEAALSGLAGVRQAVVVVREDTPGDPRLVAYVAGDAPAGALRQSLRERLPEFMVPAAFVTLTALPLTPNGKVDRKALPAPEWQRPEDFQALRTPLEEALARIWAELLGLEQVGATDPFFEIGGHSLLLVRVQARIAKELGREVSLVDLFRYPTVRALAGFLEPDAEIPSPSPRSRAASPESGRVAIIGMSGRFPGASGVEVFWRNLCAGIESISFHADADLAAAGIDPALSSSPHFVPAGGVLEGIERFDAGFFGYTPRDAEITDPQHRLFLECAWEALEGAGYVPERCPGPVGVFAGAGRSNYLLRNLLSRPEIVQAMGSYRIGLATDKDFLATNVSYKLDFKGPSLSIQTACSTSLVAVHVACRSLLAGECDMALAGGVSIAVPQRTGYLYQEGEILSPDGHCRAFDAGASGTVGGSGVGVVVLKRLDDALADGDPIRAVILGSAINNDGSGKVGYTAPSVDGQAEVIRAALEAGGVDPRTVGYVEAHGTATPLGDPIEMAALTQAFRAAGAGERGFCAVGSVKTNVGHLDTAAGVAGLIKAALAVERGLIPPSLHFASPNPAIDFAASPFHVNDRLQTWRPDGLPRRAGVSSFGIGGTNAHVVLEEAPPMEPSVPSRRHEVLLLSARTPAALEEATRNLAGFLAAHPDASLPDVAWTLQVGRRAFEHRRMLVCEGPADAVAHLREPSRSERVLTRRQEPGRRAVAFLFPGQGAQYPDMGRELYEEEPVFRAELETCAERLLPILGRDLREVLFPAAERREEAARELQQTRFAQPALFAVELALARLWISWGIRPAAMIGHSLGEYVAACLAGVFSREDALELVAARGALMQELPPGAMLSVERSEGELAPELEAVPELSLAAVNAASRCVVSGPEAAVELLEARLVGKGVQVRRLRTSHAFHSAMMDPVLAAFGERVSRISRKPPALPFISNLTGTWITAAQATDPGYWVRHLRETVRFAEGAETLLADSRAALLEVGPGGALADLVRRQPEAAARPAPISSLPRAGATEPGSAVLRGALGRLWLCGVEIDWRAVHAGERRRRVPLPTYPFERQRFWIEASPHGLARPPVADRRRFTVLGGDPDEPLARTLQAGGHEVESAANATDLAGLFKDPRNVEALARLLALEPGIRVVLPQALEAVAAPETGAPTDLSPSEQAPGNEVERRIAAIWRDLLGIAEVGAHDSFFELGGDSLLATRVMARVREAFGQELPLQSLYDTPTVAGLAARIETGMPAGDAAPPLAPAGRSGPLPLSFAQQRLLYLHLLAPQETAYNLPLGLRLSGPLDPRALAEALRRLAGRHEVLRTTFAVDEERMSQIVSPVAETGGLPWIDLSALPQDTARTEGRRLALEDSALPFDLLREPVWRGFLVRLEPEEHVLILTLHHVAADGWSFGILFRETVELYESLVEGRSSRLPDLPVQYADFALWQRSWLQGETLDRLLGYWQRQLAGLPALHLPTDRPRPAVRTGRGGARFALVPPEPVESLRRLAHQEDATLFMALSAAFSLLLRRDSGSDDVVLGTDIANRTHRETEGLIGLFVNQLVLRHDLSGDPSFRELLRRVRRVILEAYAHQDAPFDKLVEILNPPRDPGRTPLFQVKIVLQNTPSETRTLRGLAVSALGLHRQTAKFDLLLNLTETASGLACEMEYSSDLYEATTIDRLLDRLIAVLRIVSEQPEARLGEIDRALGLSDLRTREERARGRRSQAILRVQHRRNTVLSR